MSHNQKEKIYLAKKLNFPENVKFVETNFLKDSLKRDLLNAGLNPKLNTMFLMEGVTMYLDEKSINETLNDIREISNESILAFDCFEENSDFKEYSIFAANLILKVVGEKFTFQFPNVKNFLKERNFFEIQTNLQGSQVGSYLESYYGKDLKGQDHYNFVICKKIKV